MVSFGRKHINFQDPAKFVKAFNQRTDDVTSAKIGLARKLNVGLAFVVSYYEHGLGCWSLKGEGLHCPWDSVPLAGILLWSGKPADIRARTLEDRAGGASDFLERYNAWANGETFWVRLSNENGEEIESFGGLNGVGAVSEVVGEALEAGDKVKVEGDAGWLKNHLMLTEGVKLVEEPTAA